MTLLKSSTCCLNVGSVKWIDGLLELWLLNEIFVYKYNFYVFTWEVVLSIKLIWVLHINKWLSIKDRVSGWGQSFVPPPPHPKAHCLSHVDAELCVILSCYFSVKGRRNLFPTFFPLPCPRVLLFGLIVPHLYNVLGTQVMWFCLLQ